MLSRTTLSSVNQDHERGKYHATEGSLLGSAIWITAAHKMSEGVGDGMHTQVWAGMTNKCRIKMDRKEIYKIRNLPKGGGGSQGGGGAQVSPSCLL